MKRLLFVSAIALSIFAIGGTAHHSLGATQTLAQRLAGYFLIQTQSRGELWFVSSKDGLRHLVASRTALLELYAREGIGASNAILSKIPLATDTFNDGDMDSDGLTDAFERAIGSDPNRADTDRDTYADGLEVKNGYNPLGVGRTVTDAKIAAAQRGKILLQVESRGEAWYVNPVNSTRYYLGDPTFAKPFLGKLALGISNADIVTIPEASPVPLAPGAKNCGRDWACVVSEARACRSAQFVWHLTAAREGFEQHTTTVLEVQGLGEAKCNFKITDARYDLVFDAGTTKQTMDSENVRYDAVEGRNAACAYTPTELGDMLKRWSQNLISSDDFTAGACAGSYFGT